MSDPVPQPDEATLRKFLLGTLPPEQAADVSRWAIESGSAAQLLGSIEARDTIVDAIGEASTSGDTSSLPQLVNTVRQVVTPVASSSVAVGGYRVLRELGRGGMGVVLEAEDPHLKRLVAIKLIAAEFAANPAARDRFLREARAVAKIEHENVVPILHVGEDAGQLYLVMPLLKGETLDARLRRDTRLPVDDLQRIGREVAAGLAAAHAVGLVHRDVKPANIWLEAGTGRVKLLDFGLAKPTEEADTDANLTDTGAVMGTPHYMSPEQAEGRPVDSRTDLFSLGAVLYHAATGQRPFQGDTKLAVLIAVTKETPPRAEKLNTDLSLRVADLLRAMLEKNPKNRPNSATDVITELQDAPAPKEEPTRPARFPRWAVAVGLLAAAVLVAAVVVIIRDKDGKEVARIEVPEGGSVEIKNGKGSPDITDGKGSPDIGKEPPTPAPAAAADRKAAEWVLSVGGTVRVNDTEEAITEATKLPKNAFRLTGVDFNSNAKVTDAGLALFKDCKNLTALDLHNMMVTDAGLALFKDCKNLTNLYVKDTKVTAKGVTELAKALPGCKITWEGGIIEPGSNPDRKAAEYVLSIGGTVRVNDKDSDIKAVADLPKEPFRLTVVGLAKNSVVTNAGLAAFKDCKNLTELNLALCDELGDAGLAHFKGCTKLHDLDVSGTRVTDAGLATLAANDKLFRLTANVTDIGDAGLAALDKHTDIGFLFLNDTKLTDASLKRFANLKKLAVLQIDGTAVTDAGLAALAGNTALRGLDVRNTKVTAKGITTLAKALPLCRIAWDGGVIEPKK